MTRPEWLPSQTWQARAAQRQIEAQVARDEYAQHVAGRRRKAILAVGVIALTAIVVPLSIRTEMSFADDLDPIHAYAESGTQTATLGERVSEHVGETTEQEAASADAEDQGEVPAEGASDPDDEVAPAQGVVDDRPASTTGNSTDSRGQAPARTVTTQAYIQPLTPSATEGDTVVTSDQGGMAESTMVAEQQPAQPQVEQVAEPQQEPAPAAPIIKEWTSVPSWGSAAAPHYDALGKWDSNYYIAHNWTSYGEVILNMQPGEVVRVDGQLLVATKAEVFGSGTDYETVRDWCGWDAWCLQTCYGDNHVRIVALNPLEG